MNAITKFRQRAAAINSLLCVGLDTDAARVGNVFDFNRRVIDATHDLVCAYKPNLAFYEARGAEGWADLERTIVYLRKHYPDILTICDAKRGDIGSTNAGYVTAFYDELGFDAITLHPYLGREALAPFLDRADKAAIILCRTSNPGASELQDQQIEGVPLWRLVAERVRDHWNMNSNCMLVVGATYPTELRTVREIVGDMPLLVPGIGAQGGDVDSAVRAGIDSTGGGLIVNASRSILYADDPRAATRELYDAINRARNAND